MGRKTRSHQGYEAIESCPAGNTGLVIGHNPEAPNPYVCWFCKGGSYWRGYYCNRMEAAKQKLEERYRSETHMPYNKTLKGRKTKNQEKHYREKLFLMKRREKPWEKKLQIPFKGVQ